MKITNLKSQISNLKLRVALAVLLSVAVVGASGFVQERLRVAEVGEESRPTRTLYLNGTVTRAGNDATYTPTSLNAGNLVDGTVPVARLPVEVGWVTTGGIVVSTGSVLTLNTTPVVLLSSPGAGKVILIEEIVCKLIFNSVAYTGSNALEFRYTDGGGAKVTADIGSAFLNSASGTNYQSVKGVTTALAPVAAAGVVVTVPTANPGAGNSPLVFNIKYRIVTP